jgi:sugar/nucleoside kinase (ribokinase family)
MIVVLGRPSARLLVPDARLIPDGACVAIARSAVAAGGAVELVGSVGDDEPGDAVVVGLGREGIGHAAVLRDPRAATPVAGRTPGGPAPALERGDVDLGLGYVPDVGVLVLAEALTADAEDAALDAAAYHGAQVVAIVPPGTEPARRLAAVATVFEAPGTDTPAFAAMVGRFAAELDRGTAPGVGFATATAASGWEPSA